LRLQGRKAQHANWRASRIPFLPPRGRTKQKLRLPGICVIVCVWGRTRKLRPFGGSKLKNTVFAQHKNLREREQRKKLRSRQAAIYHYGSWGGMDFYCPRIFTGFVVRRRRPRFQFGSAGGGALWRRGRGLIRLDWT
jgi:hypothetical protein